MRPTQWTKNGLLFMALIFSKNLFEPSAVLKTLAAFFIFSLISGCVYIINDILDREKDREHPLKKKRPIASGRLTIGGAWFFVSVITIASLTAAFLLTPAFGFITAVYFVLFNLYTFFLKAAPIVDVLVVASGFVIRAVAGGLAIEVEISSWLLMCTMLLALFVVLGKRRHEILLLGENAASHRGVLHEYNTVFLDQMIAVVTASTLVSYSFYTISAETVEKFGTENLKYTILFVLYGIFRYLYIIYRKEAGGRPEKDIFTDIPTLVNLLLWGATAVIILYMG
jgi:4-hydroxybenzoate polyprenyltransferase